MKLNTVFVFPVVLSCGGGRGFPPPWGTGTLYLQKERAADWRHALFMRWYILGKPPLKVAADMHALLDDKERLGIDFPQKVLQILNLVLVHAHA